MKKNLIKISICFIASIMLFSCGDPDKTVYDSDINSSQTLIRIDQPSYNLPVVIESSSSIEVQVNVSTVSEEARTFDIDFLEDDSDIESTLDFDFENTVTIPAGEYTGTFTVTGADQGLTNESESTLVFELLVDNDDIVQENMVTTVTAYRVCPVPSDFLFGEYEIIDETATIGPPNNSENFRNQIVNIGIGSTPFERVFDVVLLPGLADTPVTVTLTLQCGNINLMERLDTGIGCSAGNTIKYGPAENPSTYDVDNPQPEYIINYIEDATQSCDGSPFNSSFKLTKINQ